jgi:opacity protein-like surface antigen
MSARSSLALTAFTLAFLSSSSPFVVAEPYVAGFLGRSFPQEEDLEASLLFKDALRFSGGSGGDVSRDVKLGDLVFHRAGFQSSLVYGGKIGYFFNRRILGGNIGLETEAYYFRPDIEAQETIFSGQVFLPGPEPGNIRFRIPVKIESSDIGAIGIAMNVLYRHPFRVTPRYPLGRFQMYAGPGIGVLIERFELTDRSSRGVQHIDDTDAELGFQAVGGLKVFMTRRIALFGEYRFVQTGDFEHHFEIDRPAGFGMRREVFDLTFDRTVNQVYGGLAFHFK